MKIKDSLIISSISIITLVAEFILYMIFVVPVTAIFFVSLMIFTASVGILSPICAFIGHITKREKVGNIILIIFLSLIVIFLSLIIIYSIVSYLIFSKFM